MRNPQNLAGSVPNVPTSANILIQKKEQKSLLLESVIPAGKAMRVICFKHSKRSAICTKYPHTILTKELTCWIC